MAGPLLLGIDLGTTTCRAALFDLEGLEVAAAAVEIPVRYPRPLWAEVDPDRWWEGVTTVVRAALRAGAVDPERVAGVGLSGLMHAPVLLDAAGEPVTPAVLWMDQRCAPQCDAIRREAAAAGAPLSRELSSTLTGPKLRWLAEEQPETLARAAHLLLPKDYIRFRLCGALGSDPGDAGGTGLFDRRTGAWLWDLVERCRVPRRLLPELRPADAPAGAVTPAAAAATGLRAGTPVAVGGPDTLCTRLGAGRLAPGGVLLYLGTAAWISVAGPGAGGAGSAGSADGAELTGGAAIGGRTGGFGATSTTGATLRWLRDLLGPLPADGAAGGAAAGGAAAAGALPGVSASYDALTRLAAAVPPGAEGLLFLPHLMGERGPVADPLARGAFAGLTLRHERGHLTRAVIEGTAFHLRRLIEARSGAGAPAAGLACGGAARSPLWMQVLADVTRLPLQVPAVVEAAVLGAAILGGAAAGAVASLDEAQQRMVRPGATYHPDSGQAALYDALYARYCRLDDLLAPWFRELAEGEPVAG